MIAIFFIKTPLLTSDGFFRRFIIIFWGILGGFKFLSLGQINVIRIHLVGMDDIGLASGKLAKKHYKSILNDNKNQVKGNRDFHCKKHI